MSVLPAHLVMGRAVLVGAFLIFICIGFPIAKAQPVSEEMLFMDDPKLWATPKAIVAPVFPNGELAKQASGYVDAEVRLTPRGRVKSHLIVKSQPKNEAFEAAVTDVIAHWQFHESLNSQCAPVEAAGNVRTWFEIRDGKGVVSVSGQTALQGDSFARQVKKAVPSNQFFVGSSLKYPVMNRRDGVEADLYVVLSVNAKSGTVSDVRVSGIFADARSKPENDMAFAKNVMTSFRRYEFAPQEGNDFKVCKQVLFRLN